LSVLPQPIEARLWQILVRQFDDIWLRGTERNVEKAAVLQVIKAVWINEKDDGIDGKRANAGDRQSAEETARSICSIHSPGAVYQAGVATAVHVRLCRTEQHPPLSVQQ